MYLSFRVIAGYPAVRLFIAMSVGIVAGRSIAIPTSALFFPAGCLVATSALLLLFAGRHRALSPLRDAALTILLIAAGMCAVSHRLEQLPRAALSMSDTRDKLTVLGVVASAPRSTASGQALLVRCDTLRSPDSTLVLSEKLMLYYTRSSFVAGDVLTPLKPGDRIRAVGKLRSPRPARNPWGFDAREMLLLEGLSVTFGVSKGPDLTVTGYEDPGNIRRLLFDLRSWIGARLSQLFGRSHEPLMRGLLLGDRGDIERDVLDDFRASGIMHILAVSGLHAGIIVSMVLIPLERLRFGIRGALAIAAVWGFAGVTGFAPPVTRAAIMSTLFIVGRVVQRRNTTVNALAAAGVVILILDPLALFTLSFQLSFGAVLGILLFHSRIKTVMLRIFPKKLRKGSLASVVSLLALTAAAQVCTIPLMIPVFGEFSLVGFAVNLPAVPLVFVAVSCGMLAVSFGALWPWLGATLAQTAAGALDFILTISEWSAAQPWAVLRIPEFPQWLIPVYLGFVVLFAYREGWLRQKIVLAGLAIIMLFVVQRAVQPTDAPLARFTFLDVGQGDATVVHFPGEATVLIDTGPSSPTSNSGATVIVPYLRRCGIDTLDVLVLTHLDNDHIGGAISVLEAMVVRRVLIACSWPDHGEPKDVLQCIQREGVIVQDARAGDVLALTDAARLYVLSPEDSIACESSNSHSVVTMLRYGSTRWLFTGDADVEAEARMLLRYDTLLRADVLKVGHHGSTTSTADHFANVVQPEHAVICAGRLNHFKHPKYDVLDRLSSAGASIHRTDIEGAVIFESDGRMIRKLIQRE